jgi:hypothetical protein
VRTTSISRAAAIAAALLACCGREPVPVDGVEPALDTTGFREISIVDSVGLETGEEPYVFGAIESMTHGRDGSIVLLDRAWSEIRVFTPEGEYARSIGGQGSGPGELNMTVFMGLSSGGRLFVSQRGAMNEFDFESGEWIGAMNLNAPPPAAITGSTDSTFVAVDMAIVPEEGQLSIDISLSRFTDPYVTDVDYLQDRIVLDNPADVTGFLLKGWEGYAFDVDSLGNVFVAPYSTGEYLILGFTADGQEMLRIEREIPPVAKSAEEMAEEQAFVQTRCESMDMGPVTFTPDPDRRMIRGLGVDGQGRIWALRGTCLDPVFDVYDQGGGFLFSAMVRGAGEDGRYWRFVIDPQGMLGWSDNPSEGYQKFYILRLED